MSATTPTGTAIEFTITDAALAQVRSVMAQQTLAPDERNLRIFVEGGGGGGMGFGLAFDKAQDDDVRLERGGLGVVIDPASLPYVTGATIDFVQTPEVTGFKVTGAPRPAGGGGCGGGSCSSESGESKGSCGGGSCGSGGGGGGHSHEHGGHSHGGHGHEHGGHSHGAPKQSGGGCGSGGGGCC